MVWISLHSDFETVARSKADCAWSHLIQACEARLARNGRRTPKSRKISYTIFGQFPDDDKLDRL